VAYRTAVRQLDVVGLALLRAVSQVEADLSTTLCTIALENLSRAVDTTEVTLSDEG
jgi:hypothetical protein